MPAWSSAIVSFILRHFLQHVDVQDAPLMASELIVLMMSGSPQSAVSSDARGEAQKVQQQQFDVAISSSPSDRPPRTASAQNIISTVSLRAIVGVILFLYIFLYFFDRAQSK